MHSLINDFTFQYPDLITTISCLLYNILCGYQISHRELIEEFELMRMILGIWKNNIIWIKLNMYIWYIDLKDYHL